jgi:hypothetical protein
MHRGAARAASDERAELVLAIMDTVPSVERRIAPELRLEVRKEGDGWEVAATATADTLAENLLYHSREWHGPYPTQVYAWSEAAHYFGDGERALPVRGYPWMVRLRCDGCKTVGTGETARFIAGVLRIRWERRVQSDPEPYE